MFASDIYGFRGFSTAPLSLVYAFPSIAYAGYMFHNSSSHATVCFSNSFLAFFVRKLADSARILLIMR